MLNVFEAEVSQLSWQLHQRAGEHPRRRRSFRLRHDPLRDALALHRGDFAPCISHRAAQDEAGYVLGVGFGVQLSEQTTPGMTEQNRKRRSIRLDANRLDLRHGRIRRHVGRG